MEDNQVFAIYQEHRLRLTDHYNRISQQTGLTVRTVRDLFDNNYIFRQEINKPDTWIKDGWGERTET